MCEQSDLQLLVELMPIFPTKVEIKVGLYALNADLSKPAFVLPDLAMVMGARLIFM